MTTSKQLLIQMTSNAQTFDLQEAIYWDTATLERTDVVDNNNVAINTAVVHIDQMPTELMVCSNGVTKNRTGSFFVGSGPFNPQETLTVRNTNPSKPINHLDVRIYDTAGTLANITNAFVIKLKINKV